MNGRIIISAFLIFSPVISWAGDYELLKLQSFTRSLVENREYARGLVELRRIKSFYPGAMSDERFSVAEDYLLFNSHNHSELIAKKNIPVSVTFYHSIFVFDSALSHDKLLSIDKYFTMNSPGDDFNDILYFKRKMLADIVIDRETGLRKYLSEVNRINSRYSDALMFASNTFKELKSPAAALFAGVIPGGGYAYSGDTGTGIVAFVVVAVSGFISWMAFRTRNEPVGVVFTAATAFFYGGSIIGGYMDAHRRNDALMQNLKDGLAEKLDLASDRESIYKKYGL